jgi:hypothetical protein
MNNNQPKDYFKILGITEKDLDVPDPKKVVKGAFRRLARQYHPDVSNDPNGEEKFKELNEAFEVFFDPKKLTSYLRDINNLGLSYGKDSQQSEKNIHDGIDVLGGLTFKLPKFGWDRSGIAMKDVLEAMTRFYKGEDIEEINNWVEEKSMAWKLVESEKNKGNVNLYIRPRFFLVDTRKDVYLIKKVYGLSDKANPQWIDNDDFVDIRYYTGPQVYGELTNIIIGDMDPSTLGDIIDMAVFTIARYQAGDVEIHQTYQEFARNILRSAARDYPSPSFYDEITIPKQHASESSYETRPALPATLK